MAIEIIKSQASHSHLDANGMIVSNKLIQIPGNNKINIYRSSILYNSRVWSSTNWTYLNNVWTPNPAYTGDLITNGTFEAGDPPTGWSPADSGAISSDATVYRSGTKSCRVTFNGSGAFGGVLQATTSVIGVWYKIKFWVRGVNVATSDWYLNYGGDIKTLIHSNGTWNYIMGVKRATAVNHTAKCYMWPTAAGNANKIYNVDDFTVESITPSNLFVLSNYSSQMNIATNLTMSETKVPGGVVSRYSDANNFLICWHNRTGVFLEGCIAGAWTTYINGTAATYVAGAPIEIRWAAANTAQAWYNGVQIGVNQDVAAVPAGNLAGLFGTDSTVSLTTPVVS